MVVAAGARADGAQLEEAIAAAKRAFPAWSSLAHAKRQDYLIRLADAMEARENDFYTLLTREQGKPLDQARFEVGGAIEIGRASCSGKSVSVRVDLGGRRIIKKRHHLSEHL